VINVKLEIAMNTFETSVNIKMAHYSAVGRNDAGFYSSKTSLVYSGDTGFQRCVAGCPEVLLSPFRLI
jgi:hypothetical protein